MDEIIESIRNGQRKQALTQLMEGSYPLEHLFERLIDEDMVEDIIPMYKVAISTGYILLADDWSNHV